MMLFPLKVLCIWIYKDYIYNIPKFIKLYIYKFTKLYIIIYKLSKILYIYMNVCLYINVICIIAI